MSAITAEQLLQDIEAPDAPFLLDVREPDEFDGWHIAGAVNVPLGDLDARLDELPTRRNLVVVCAAGVRAERAAALLAGHDRPCAVLEGGMASWGVVCDEAELPLGPVTVVQVRRRGKGCLSYLVGTGEGAVAIDPGTDTARYVHLAADHGWRISHVLDTHLHADHVSGARALSVATGAELLLNPGDPFDFPFTPLTDGTTVALADTVDLTVATLLTPGHTMGSTLFRLGGEALFTGDTLMLESVGRPDLYDRADEFAHALYESLHDKVLVLPDSALVFPAHLGPNAAVHTGVVWTASLGELRNRLWMLSATEEAFVAWAIGAVRERPPNYLRIVEANRGHGQLEPDELRALELGPNRCAVAT